MSVKMNFNINKHSSLIIFVSYLLLLLVLSLFHFERNTNYSVDDSFITYRYAFHLREGYGLVFNIGEAYYGTTAAGYAAVLTLFSSLGIFIANILTINESYFSIQNVSTFLSTMSLTTVSLLMFHISGARKSILLSIPLFVFTSLLFYASPFNEVSGHETYAYLATAFAGTVLVVFSNSYYLGAFFLAISASFRPDAVLFAAIVPVVDLFRSELSFKNYLKIKFLGFTAVYILVLGSWLLYLTIHFGSPVPGTMAAKKVQVALGYWPLYTMQVLREYFSVALNSLGFNIVKVGLLGLILRYKFKEQTYIRSNLTYIAVVWILFGVLSASAYLIFNVTFWPWYGVPLFFSVLITTCIGWIKIFNLIEFSLVALGQNNKKIRLVELISISIIVLALILYTFPRMNKWATTKNINLHTSSYSEIVDFISKDSPQGAVIQISEPGSLAFHLGPKYKVVDELGLISPGVAQALKRKDFSYTTNTWKAKYLVCSWRGHYSACANSIILKDYNLAGEFNNEFWKPMLGSGAKLFKRKE